VKLTKMPEPAEMMRRLAAVNNTPWNIEHFYPKIALVGGTERFGFGLPLLFETAIADVCEGDPIASTLRLQVPSWLRAIVDDGEVLADALEAFEQVSGGAF